MLSEVIEEVDTSIVRLETKDFSNLSREQLATELKAELFDNLYPILKMGFEKINEEMNDLRADVDDVMDMSEDMLQPDTAKSILGVFELGKVIAKELEGCLPMISDAKRKTRLVNLVASYRQTANAIGAIVEAVTIEPEENQPGAPGADGDDAEDDDQAADAEGEE